MKIKIVGQPMFNIGDLAACKTLIKLLTLNANNQVELIVSKGSTVDPKFSQINNIQISDEFPNENRILKWLIIFFPNILKVLLIFPGFNKKYKKLKNSDLFIFAPGGLEFGLYQSWKSVLILATLVGLNKKFALYSRSIGDFPTNSIMDKIFIKRVIRYLNESIFNGIRDSESQRIAKELGIKYYPTIDIVFSIESDCIKNDIIKFKMNPGYIVFTPSEFNWHRKLNLFSKDIVTNLYIDIFNILLEKSNVDIIMLPHIYKDDSDKTYFNEIRDKIGSDRIVIIDEFYDPDEYQVIIRNAKFVVAARSHQAIFAINNNVPVLCLSYEHKMMNLFMMLGLEKFSIDLFDLLSNKNKLDEIKTIIDELISSKSDVHSKFKKAQKKANQIAQQTFSAFNQLIS